ncbi:MAG TPA: lipopolysaccharide heptosyltransferase I [Desulfuromonadaceae bacterium]|jgi:heptosyltransferase-1
MRVLIIKTSSLGDIIHALPVLDYLHKASPGIEIGWVVEEAFRDLLEDNPLLNNLHVLKTRSWKKSLFSSRTRQEVSGLIRELRACKYDIAFDIQGNLKSGIVGVLSGTEKRIGLPRQLLQESINALFTTIKTPFSPAYDHAVPRYLSVVSLPFGLDYHDLRLASDISTSSVDNAKARTFLAGLEPGRKILFHCGTTWQTKFWSPEGWSALGAWVTATYPDASILLSWGNDGEKTMALDIASHIGNRAVACDRLSLKGFTALLKQVDLVVGGDTGPVHLAAAVGTPTVSLYRSSDGRASGPRGERHVIIQSPMPCTRCFHTTCARDAECRASIPPTALAQGIARLLTP